jgi:acyl carrier protein
MTKGTEETVREIIAELLAVDEEQITARTRLDEDLGADSLDLAELAMRIEDELLDSEAIEGEILEGWRTVEDVVESAEQLRKARRA